MFVYFNKRHLNITGLFVLVVLCSSVCVLHLSQLHYKLVCQPHLAGSIVAFEYDYTHLGGGGMFPGRLWSGKYKRLCWTFEAAREQVCIANAPIQP